MSELPSSTCAHSTDIPEILIDDDSRGPSGVPNEDGATPNSSLSIQTCIWGDREGKTSIPEPSLATIIASDLPLRYMSSPPSSPPSRGRTGRPRGSGNVAERGSFSPDFRRDNSGGSSQGSSTNRSMTSPLVTLPSRNRATSDPVVQPQAKDEADDDVFHAAPSSSAGHALIDEMLRPARSTSPGSRDSGMLSPSLAASRAMAAVIDHGETIVSPSL